MINDTYLYVSSVTLLVPSIHHSQLLILCSVVEGYTVFTCSSNNVSLSETGAYFHMQACRLTCCYSAYFCNLTGCLIHLFWVKNIQIININANFIARSLYCPARTWSKENTSSCCREWGCWGVRWHARPPYFSWLLIWIAAFHSPYLQISLLISSLPDELVMPHC